VALALVGLMAWLLIRPAPWAVHLVYLPISEYDIPVTPVPPPVGPESLEQLRLSIGDRRTDVSQWADLQTSRSIATLADKLKGLVATSHSALILYVSAQGISDSRTGTAYLLCSDFLRLGDDPSQPIPGRYELGQLLAQVHTCQAELKLMILDTNYAPGDTRLGTVVNEFPRLVQAEVDKFKDPCLWVLLGTHPLELSHVSYPARQSVFGRFVAEGLGGAADQAGNQDHLVDLAELFDFVRNGVSNWVYQQSSRRETQTPQLLAAGQAQPGPGMVLTRVRPLPDKQDKAESPAGPPAEPPGAAKAAAQGVVPPAKTAAAPEKAPPATAKPGSPPAPPSPPAVAGDAGQGQPSSARQRVRLLIAKAWQQRDQMQDRGTGDGWTPVDYAPHLWREYQELLLGYEVRYRYGMELSPQKLAALEDLAEGRASAAGSGDASILARLQQAREQFQQQPVVAQLQKAPAELAVVKAALQLKNDLLLAAAEYVRWRARALYGDSEADLLPLDEELTQLVGRQLPEFVNLLQSLEETEPAGESFPVDLREKLQDLRNRKNDLEKLRAALEQGRDGLRKNAAELLEAFDHQPDVNRTEGLLATALLPGKLRMALLDLLERAPRSTAQPPLSAPQAEAEMQRMARNRWLRLSQQAALEVQLVRLMDPAWRPTAPLPAAFPTAGDGAWLEYRQLGNELAAFYQALPQRVNEGCDSASAAEVQRAARLFRLVDGRDVPRLGPHVGTLAVRPISLPRLLDLHLELSGPANAVRLDRGAAWVPFEVVVRATGRPCKQVDLTPQFNADQVELASREATPPLAPAKETRLALPEGQTLTLSLQVRPRPGAQFRESLLALSIKAANQEATGNVHFSLPAADVVDLALERVVDETGRSMPISAVQGLAGAAASPDTVVCPVFPNRNTDYVFALKNRSGAEKKVSVQLWSLPQRLAGHRGLPGGPRDRWGKPLPGFTVLAGPVEVKLPAEESSVTVDFSAKPEAKKGAEKAASATEKPDAEKHGPPEKPLITAGLVCVITDVTQKNSEKPPWIEWIDFAPVAPRLYLEPEVSYTHGEIAIRLKLARDPSLLPVVTPEHPVEVSWDTAGVFDAETRMIREQKIAAADEEKRLFADVGPTLAHDVVVRLTVDGYPRALVYQPFKCDRDRPQIELDRDLRDVRITLPPPHHAYRVPLEKPLAVAFQVDAPTDAFQRPDDLVEVWLDLGSEGERTTEGKQQFHTDRQVQISLREFGPQGLMKIDTRVGDFAVVLKPGGLVTNTEGEVKAQLRLFRREPRVAAVPIVLDSAKPEFGRIVVPARVIAGKDAEITVEAKDAGSGVAKIEVGFDADETGSFKDKPLEFVPPGLPGVKAAAAKFLLSTKDLKPGQVYRLLLRATDRVGLTQDRTELLAIEAPPLPAEPAAATSMPTLTTILGRVVGGSGGSSLSWAGLEVNSKELGRAAEANSDGSFTFKDVPPGKYTIHARGIWGNAWRDGEESVTVTGADPVRVEVRAK
jgi:hypothetical protein